MKDFAEFSKKRKTTYEFDQDKNVPENELNKVLDIGRWAPSCTNSQPWQFIVVRDKKKIEELVQTTNYGFFNGRPSVIIAVCLIQDLCAGPNFGCFRGDEGGVYDHYMSVACAVLNMSYGALDLGIDSCIMTPDVEKAGKILRVRGKNKTCLMLGLGYEKKGAYQKKRIRRPLREMISYETYKRNGRK